MTSVPTSPMLLMVWGCSLSVLVAGLVRAGRCRTRLRVGLLVVVRPAGLQRYGQDDAADDAGTERLRLTGPQLVDPVLRHRERGAFGDVVPLHDVGLRRGTAQGRPENGFYG